MSRRKDRARTPGLWIATNALPVPSVLSAAKSGPDTHVRRVRRGAVRPVLRRDGRPSQSAAGDHFRLLLIVLRTIRSVGSPGGTRWRCAAFSGWASEATSTRRLPDAALIDLETHRAVFTWILQVHGDGRSREGQDDRDRCTPSKPAALRSIVRRDSGRIRSSGRGSHRPRASPPRADRARLDRQAPEEGPLLAASTRPDHENEGRAYASGPRLSTPPTWRLWA